MYEIDIFNNGVKTTVHYPDPDASKVIQPHINKKRGQAGSLTFSIYTNNPGYNLITRMATLITVTDVRDNKEVFSGRIYTSKNNMDNNGLLKKDVVCEGEMNYLHDSNVGSTIYEDKTAQQMLQTFLDIHNSQVEDYKKIYLGNVTVNDWIFCTTGLENTLDAIIKYVYNADFGYLQLRKTNGVKYLDYLKTTSDKTVSIQLGKNLIDLIQTDDQDFGTRIIPVGANDLTMENVNGGKNYLEDSTAVAKYGIIYKTVEFKDIDDDTELMKQCQAQLSSYTTPKQSLEIDALDLATLANTSIDMIDENTSVHIINQIMNIDEVWKVVEYDADLNEVYKPKVTLSSKAVTLTGTLNSLIGSMVRNDDSYNGVQIGNSFGLRIRKGSNIILLNAKEGISIKNGDTKVFYIDTDGNLVAQDGTFNDITANRGTYNKITANDMVANEMKTSNTTNYMILHDQYIDFYHAGIKRMRIGFDSAANNFPTVTLYNQDGSTNGIGINGVGELGTLGPMSFDYPVYFYSTARIKGEDIATQEWVKKNYEPLQLQP